jgi:hypothetical protein
LNNNAGQNGFGELLSSTERWIDPMYPTAAEAVTGENCNSMMKACEAADLMEMLLDTKLKATLFSPTDEVAK